MPCPYDTTSILILELLFAGGPTAAHLSRDFAARTGEPARQTAAASRRTPREVCRMGDRMPRMFAGRSGATPLRHHLRFNPRVALRGGRTADHLSRDVAARAGLPARRTAAASRRTPQELCRMGDRKPRMFAGHGIPCPYEENPTATTAALPSMCAGHGMPCPYDTTCNSHCGATKIVRVVG
jgi:hypothetical protein